MTKTNEGRPVVVTTEFRGVFFGFAADASGDTITLKNARNCIYWDTSIGGFMGLAKTGPNKQCRIGAMVESIQIRKITSVIEMNPSAVAAWQEAKTHGE